MAYCNRAIAKSDLGLHKEAIKDYDKAIYLNPYFAIAYYNRGVKKRDLKLYIQAKKDFERAI